MCGLVGAVSKRDITNILLNSLLRLEYRGYDSSGLAIINYHGKIDRLRRLGKVNKLIEAVNQKKPIGNIGIAQTRWATHGEPSEINAHPHISNNIVIVHNGIIENHEFLRQKMKNRGYKFLSSTDTEVIAHLIHWEQNQTKSLPLELNVKRVLPQLSGNYSMLIIDSKNPTIIVACCSGSPLVIGCGLKENFIASDQLALLPVTSSFIYMEEGDIAVISNENISINNKIGNKIKHNIIEYEFREDESLLHNKGNYKHFMQKEIYEQPHVISNTLKGRINNNTINLSELNSVYIQNILKKVDNIKIVACGTSYNAGMVSRYWFESLAKISCDIEIASEFRYRKLVTKKNTLFITLSQSGETADTLAALRRAKKMCYISTLAICNVANSSLVRESDLVIMTKAGTEIGVASTKSFTTQLIVLLMIVVEIGKLNGMSKESEYEIASALKMLPMRINQIFEQDQKIKKLAEQFTNINNVLFLGRGDQYPIAVEGSLKLKEISYIHAEAYAAGELKHGALALIDNNMPVIVMASYNNEILDKLKSNIEEVSSRGGIVYIFADFRIKFRNVNGMMKIIALPYVEEITAPIYYVIPLQLLSYYVALLKGNDVDQPRNLAKSVTVE